MHKGRSLFAETCLEMWRDESLEFCFLDLWDMDAVGPTLDALPKLAVHRATHGFASVVFFQFLPAERSGTQTSQLHVLRDLSGFGSHRISQSVRVLT